MGSDGEDGRPRTAGRTETTRWVEVLRGRRMRRVATVLALFFVAGWACPANAVSVSVSEFDLVGKPGDEVMTSFSVFNDDPEAVDVQIVIVDWDLDGEGVTRFHEPGTVTRSCATWLDVTPTSFELASEGETEIGLCLRIPETARGTFWTGLLVRIASSDPLRRERGAGLQPVRQFLVRILQSVMPGTPDGRVRDVRTVGFTPLGVTARFENTGDAVLTDVDGLVVIEDRFGGSLAEIPIPPFDLLPGYAVDRTVRAEIGITRAGAYLIRAVFDYGAEFLVAGQVVLRLAELDLTPVAEGCGVPNDLDGDGLYEDVDGDGRLDRDDVEWLSDAFDAPPMVDNARVFDFDNDGALTAGDVDALEALVLRGAE